MASKPTAKKPAKRAAPAKRAPQARRAGDPGDTADIAEEYSRQDQRREARDDEVPTDVEDGEEMTTGTVQDQLIYQGLAENRANSGDLKRAERARDALADRTAAASNPGSDADKRATRRRTNELCLSRKRKAAKRT